MDDLEKPMLCEGLDPHEKSEPIKKLIIVSVLCLFFMIIEIIGGYLANSLAIMSDAAHLLSDISGFLISIFALYASKRPSSQIMSYGYHRAETIGALISISIIWGLVVWLLYESINRIFYPEELQPLIMMITAAIGMGVNIIMALSLHHGHGHSHGHDHSHGHSHNHDHKEHLVSKKSNHHNNNHKDHHDHDHDHDHDHNHDHHDHHDHSHSKNKKKGSKKQPDTTQSLVNHENITSNSKMNHIEQPSNITDEDLTVFDQSPSLEDPSLVKVHQKHFSEGYKESIKDSVNRTARTSHDGTGIPEFNQVSRLTNKNASCHFVVEVNSVDFQFTSSSETESEHSDICSNVEDDHENINVNAALIHIIGDLIQSLGVLVASIVLYFFPDWTFIDPACTIMFSIVVMFTTVPIAKDCIQILVESVPKHINIKKLEQDLLKVLKI